MAASVAEVTASLVREYLSRKGLKRTISCMDEEFPRTDSSINNRSSLREILHIEDLCRQNKVKSAPLKTLLEIIVKHQIESQKSNTATHYQTDSLHLKPLMDVNESSLRTACSGNTNTSRSTLKELSRSNVSSSSVFTENPSCQTDIFINYLDNRKDELNDVTREPEKKASVPERNPRNRANRIRRGMMTGPILNSHQDSNQRKPSQRRDAPQPLLRPEEDERASEDGLSVSGKRMERVTTALTESRELWSEPASVLRENTFGIVPEGKCKTKNGNASTKSSVDYTEVTEMVLDDIDHDEYLPEVSTLSFHKTTAAQSEAEYLMDQDTASKLKMVLLGSCLKCFSAEWKNQSFTFSETSDLRYGIVQKKGGPCGVLAAVQAYILKHLLFEDIGPDGRQWSQPSNATRRKCLVSALTEILWRAGEEEHAVVAIHSGRNVFTSVGKYKSDGVLEKITCLSVDNVKDLQMVLERNVDQFAAGMFGCLLLTVSALLSRSTEKVRQDMDVSTSTLIGAHGYCTQELVNLLLCGRAVSNVFDDVVELDSGDGNSTLLTGMKARCDVGLLSLFEHYNICEVGDYLKTPLYPIWLVCSESHFSVLFSLQRELLTNQDPGSEFDLYYYDGLANQEDEIRLTVAPGKLKSGNEDKDLIPPLDLCIRTRWTDASVSWNGTEPLL